MAAPLGSISRLDRLRSAVDERLCSVVGRVEPVPLRDALGETMEGGKRIRPLLAMLSCAAAGGSELDALSVGTAIELLHGASLVHDDIMDGAELRRGRPSMNFRHGTSAAILGGDLLIALAFHAIISDRLTNKPSILQEFSRTFVTLCEGQSDDIAFSGLDPVDPVAHREMVRKKTAELLAAGMAMGALVATDDRETVSALREFGLCLGMAYQANDDLLDATSTEAQIGKSAGLDAKNHRETYLTMAYPKVDKVAMVRALIEEHTRSAIAQLHRLPAGDAVESLATIASRLVERTH
jgi:geranylgeranyl pyrophosphate synthase